MSIGPGACEERSEYEAPGVNTALTPAAARRAAPSGGDVVEMVRRHRPDLGGEGGALPGAELFGMDAGAQAVPGGGLEDASTLVGGKCRLLDEHIAVVRQGSDGGQHFLDDQVHVAGAVVAILGRQGMGPEEGGLDGDRELVADPSCHLEQPDFGRHIQPVPTLDLDGGGPGFDHSPRPGGGLLEEVLGRRGPGGGHRGDDATPHGGDGLVVGTAQPGRELLGAVSGEYEMGVGIDEPGHHRSSITVDSRPCTLVRRIGAGPGVGDPPSVDCYGGSGDHRPDIGDKATDTGQEEIGHSPPTPAAAEIAPSAMRPATTSISPASGRSAVSGGTCSRIREATAPVPRAGSKGLRWSSPCVAQSNSMARTRRRVVEDGGELSPRSPSHGHVVLLHPRRWDRLD